MCFHSVDVFFRIFMIKTVTDWPVQKKNKGVQDPTVVFCVTGAPEVQRHATTSVATAEAEQTCIWPVAERQEVITRRIFWHFVPVGHSGLAHFGTRITPSYLQLVVPRYGNPTSVW